MEASREGRRHPETLEALFQGVARKGSRVLKKMIV
jgi:hypothetical protein